MAFQNDRAKADGIPFEETDAAAPDSYENSKRTRVLVALAYTICCLVWGTTWYAVRVSVEPGDGFPPNFAGALRFLIAVCLYAPLWFLFARKIKLPTRTEVAWLCLSGLFNGMYQCFIYTSETIISGGLASVIMATCPLMMAFIAAAIGLEHVRRQTVFSFLICFLGVALVCHDRMHAAGAQLMGIGLAFVAALFTSFSNITLKGRGTKIHPVASATIFLLATDIPVWIASVLMGEHASFSPFPVGPMIAVVYMSIMSSILAFLLYLYMLKHISLMAVSTLQFVIPILALIIDMFFERRVSLSPQVWLGIAVVLSGVVFSIKRIK